MVGKQKRYKSIVGNRELDISNVTSIVILLVAQIINELVDYFSVAEFVQPRRTELTNSCNFNVSSLLNNYHV